MTKRKKIIMIIAIVLFAVTCLSVFLGIWLGFVKGKPNNQIWLRTDEYNPEKLDYIVEMEKSPNKDFVILNLTDIQVNDVRDIGKLGYTKETITRLVEEVKPDLITITGDTSWSFPRKFALKSIIKFLDGFGIPWAPIMGNHEYDFGADANWAADQFLNTEHCLFKRGPGNIGGIGNYIINIKENGEIIQSLIMLDTHAQRYYPELGKKDYDFIYESQIAWYEWAIKGVSRLAYGDTSQVVPSMMFIHIALPEYKDAYQMWEESGFDPALGFGKAREGIYSPPVNSGMFDAILALNSTKYVVCGHDHVNDFSVLYKGVQLTYGVKTGDRCYADPEANGGTVITIKENNLVTLAHKYIVI